MERGGSEGWRGSVGGEGWGGVGVRDGEGWE